MFGELGLLSFGILAFWHNRQSPLVLVSEGSVLKGNGFEVMVSDVKYEGSSSPKSIYLGKGAGVDSLNLEVGVVVEETEVGVSLGELGKGGSFLELVSEFGSVVMTKLMEVIGVADRQCVGCRGVMIIVDEATYDGQIYFVSQ